MTESVDPVDELLDAFFDFLEGIGEEPSLDHLTPEQRAEAEQLITSLKAAQGIDPYASRPSLAALLHGAVARQQTTSAETLAADLEVSLRRGVDPRARVVGDAAAQAAGLASALIVQARGLRIRVLIAGEEGDVESAYATHVPAIAAVFGAFPDTNAVLFTTAHPSAFGAIIDRDDIVTAVETPSGRSQPPRIRRPVFESTDACAHYVIDAIPPFEPFKHLASQRVAASVEVIDVVDIAKVAVTDIAASGARARLASKKEAWGSIGHPEAAFIAGALRSALEGGFDEAGFQQMLEELVDVA